MTMLFRVINNHDQTDESMKGTFLLCPLSVYVRGDHSRGLLGSGSGW